jgi:hypothetical protein
MWRNLLIVLVVYLLIQFISKAWKFRKFVLQQRDELLNQTRAHQKNMREDGEVNISSRQKKSKNDSPDDGTYVDYEEVD